MPTREEVLREKTFKGEELDLENRVYYTLHNTENLRIIRLEKTVALLITHLYVKGVMSLEEVDELLLQVVS